MSCSSAAGKSDASQELARMPRDNGKILGIPTRVVRERPQNDCSILAETQCHLLRAATAKPEILRLTGKADTKAGGTGQCRVGLGLGFQSKNSSFSQIEPRRRTRRVGTLRQHRPIALSLFTVYFAPHSRSVSGVTSRGHSIKMIGAFLCTWPNVALAFRMLPSTDDASHAGPSVSHLSDLHCRGFRRGLVPHHVLSQLSK